MNRYHTNMNSSPWMNSSPNSKRGSMNYERRNDEVWGQNRNQSHFQTANYYKSTDRMGMNNGGNQGGNSFMSFLEQRQSQVRNPGPSSTNFAEDDFRPLFDQPGSGKPLLNTPRFDDNNWDQDDHHNFNLNSPVKISLLRKDIGSKIIGKNGVLVRDLEAKSGARIDVFDIPGTDNACVEIYGSRESQEMARELITRKCGNISNAFSPSGDIKPRSILEAPMQRMPNFQHHNQGLLRSPSCPVPNMDVPYWRNAPRPLMLQPVPYHLGRGNNNLSKTLKARRSVPFDNSYNGPRRNNKRKKGKNPYKPGEKNGSTVTEKGQGQQKKMKRGSLYSDSDFVPDASVKEEKVLGDAELGGWQDGLKDLANTLNKITDDFVAPTRGPDPQAGWTSGRVAAHHFAAGSFESGFELLKELHGIVAFEPFRASIFAAYSCRLNVTFSPEMPSLQFPLKAAENSEGSPACAFRLTDVLKNLQHGYSFTTMGKFKEAMEVFRGILYVTPLLVVTDKAEVAKVRKLGIICREYIIGLSVETERLQLPKNSLEEQKRNCELAACFTRCNLQASHRMLTLSTALNLFFKLKNYKTAATFAQKLLELEPSPDMVPQLKKIVDVCNGNLRDEHPVDYEDSKNFAFCSQSFNRLANGEKELRCSFCHVRCSNTFQDQICKICTVAKIG